LRDRVCDHSELRSALIGRFAQVPFEREAFFLQHLAVMDVDARPEPPAKLLAGRLRYRFESHPSVGTIIRPARAQADLDPERGARRYGAGQR